MKTIEEKATAYADGAVENTFEIWHLKDEVIPRIEEAYKAGAREALKSQWHAPEELEEYECDRRFTKVIAVYRSRYKGSWLTITSATSVIEWTDEREEIHKGDDLIAWMPIPELPDNL